jgi:DNA (cytosine-5)-methyltransferase 1
LVLVCVAFIREFAPKAVLIENVPGLQRDGRFQELCDRLRSMGYDLRACVVSADEFGVPQRRRRLVVLAAKQILPQFEHIYELVPRSSRRLPMTAGERLHELGRQLPPKDEWHRWRQSSPAVRSRIAAVPINGSRFDLPIDMQLKCHSTALGAGGTPREATASYGRVKADLAAPTMTTRCTTPACGSFIHPTENRGLSLREAASLQTFPPSYRWSGGYDSVERQIGNAVPVWMAEALGRGVLASLKRRGSRWAAR